MHRLRFHWLVSADFQPSVETNLTNWWGGDRRHVSLHHKTSRRQRNSPAGFLSTTCRKAEELSRNRTNMSHRSNTGRVYCLGRIRLWELCSKKQIVLIFNDTCCWFQFEVDMTPRFLKNSRLFCSQINELKLCSSSLSECICVFKWQFLHSLQASSLIKHKQHPFFFFRKSRTWKSKSLFSAFIPSLLNWIPVRRNNPQRNEHRGEKESASLLPRPPRPWSSILTFFLSWGRVRMQRIFS